MGQGRHKEENITRRQAEVMQEICRFFSIYRKMPTMQQVADAFGIATPTIYDMTLLSPKIIHKLLSGELDLSWDSCRRSFPDSWAEQEKMFLNKSRNHRPS